MLLFGREGLMRYFGRLGSGVGVLVLGVACWVLGLWELKRAESVAVKHCNHPLPPGWNQGNANGLWDKFSQT